MWHKVTDKLPDKNTRYAKKHGVPVMLYDENEHRGEPGIGSYQYDSGFQELYIGPGSEVAYLPVNPTHWKELPEKP